MTSRSSNALFQWNSPVPYLFGSLAIVFVAIGLALLFVACSRSKHAPPTDGSLRDAEAKTIPTEATNTLADHEAKILVIVPGDDHPTYVAKPVSLEPNCTATGY